MFWACFSYFGKGLLVVMQGNQDSKKYVKLLEDHLLDRASITHVESWNFQQNNCPIHGSNYSKSWVANRNINSLDWPSRAHDMNPIENLWAVLARRVYYNARKISSVDELKEVVLNEWEKLEEHVLHEHIDSMQRRYIAVHASQGAKTKYLCFDCTVKLPK